MSDRSEPTAAPADDASNRIDQIADAALRLFARYGYRRSSMDDIAKEAGLAKATLYLHFKGKDDVFRAMLQLLARRADTRCREVMALDAPFATRLSALLHAHHGQAYASFGTGEHLVELKAVMASIAGPELQAFDQLFINFAKSLFTQAEKAGEISYARSGLGLDELVATLRLAAAGAKVAGDPPSREIYAERLTNIAKIFAAAVKQ
jgi:AcrR family transcriptional regulator